MNEIKHAIENKGLSYDDYTKNVNLSFIFATYAENCYMNAEDILRKTGLFKLAHKQLFNKLKLLTGKLLKNTEQLDEKHDEAFFNAVNFISKLVDVTSDVNLSDADEVKIISYIKNNFNG